MAEHIYYPAISETDKVKLIQYLLINNERSGTPDKIQIQKFISQLGLATLDDINNALPDSYISVTYAEAETLIDNEEIIPGTHYLITDKADEGIMLLGVTTTNFSLEGQGIFLNPDYQDVSDPTGIFDYTGINFDTNQGIWTVTNEGGTYAPGDLVIWNGLHYQVTFDQPSDLDGTGPGVDANYILLPKSEPNVGYVKEVDFILYDFINDSIIYRADKRGNICESSTSVNRMQWGNDNVYSNHCLNESNLDIINNRGEIVNNSTIGNSRVIVGNTNVQTITNNIFKGNSSITANFATGSLLNCYIENNTPIVLEDISHSSKKYDHLGSNFTSTLDMTDLQDYIAGTQILTIPASKHYVGIFTLNNNTGQLIEEIVNMPTNHLVRFYVQAGNDQDFVHNNVAGALANELVSDAAATNTIVGRTNGSDYIEYRRSGNLNRRENLVILA